MANVKNVKNSQYYVQVIQELKEHCNERNEDFCFDVTQTRQKFKRCYLMQKCSDENENCFWNQKIPKR